MICFSYVPTFSDFLLFNRYAVRPLSKKMLPGGIVFFLLFCLLTAQLFFLEPTLSGGVSFSRLPCSFPE